MDYKATGMVKEYLATLSDEEAKFLYMRLDQRFGGDAAEATLMMQRHPVMDAWLQTARSSGDLFNMFDAVRHLLETEPRRRGR